MWNFILPCTDRQRDSCIMTGRYRTPDCSITNPSSSSSSHFSLTWEMQTIIHRPPSICFPCDRYPPGITRNTPHPPQWRKNMLGYMTSNYTKNFEPGLYAAQNRYGVLCTRGISWGKKKMVTTMSKNRISMEPMRQLNIHPRGWVHIFSFWGGVWGRGRRGEVQ
jgi:hypothetical protein